VEKRTQTSAKYGRRSKERDKTCKADNKTTSKGRKEKASRRTGKGMQASANGSGMLLLPSRFYAL